MIAALSPSKEMNLDICFLKHSILWSMVSLVIICLMSDLPDGSPIMPVPPPNRAIGRCPYFCIHAIAIMGM